MPNESESRVMSARSAMSQFICIWRGKKILIEAPSSYAAQTAAGTRFGVKPKRQHEIIVMRADTEHSPNALSGS